MSTTLIVRARKHPRAVLAMWLWFALSGLVLAWPTAVAAGAEFRANPEADAPLFRPGSLDLLDYLWRAQGASSAELGHLAIVLPLTVLGAVIPLAVLLVALSGRERLSSPPRAIGALALFELLAVVVQVIALVGMGMLGGVTSSALTSSLGEAGAAFAGVAVFALGVLFAIVVSLLRDLASAAMIVHEPALFDAWRLAARALSIRPFGVVGAWLWRSVVGLAAVIAAGVLASRIGGKAGLLLIALTLAHQAALAWKVCFRASWLAAATRALLALDAPE